MFLYIYIPGMIIFWAFCIYKHFKDKREFEIYKIKTTLKFLDSYLTDYNYINVSISDISYKYKYVKLNIEVTSEYFMDVLLNNDPLKKIDYFLNDYKKYMNNYNVTYNLIEL